MVINALELAFAKSRSSLSGDGASDADVRRGIREFFVFVAEVVSADGAAKAIYLDGGLVSLGLSSQVEVDMCITAVSRMQSLAKAAKRLFRKLYPDLVSSAKWLGDGLDLSKVSIAHFHHVKADGAAAAQKWARLLATEVKHATRLTFSDEEWAALKPEVRYKYLWVIVTNCSIHNFHLGGKHLCKATGNITVKRSEAALQSIREAGHATNTMMYTATLSAATHTCSKMFSTSEAYAFGIAAFHKVHVARVFPNRPYFGMPRVNGSRFMYQMIAAGPFVFMRDQMQSTLGSQVFREHHSKIVSTTWAHLTSEPVCCIAATSVS